MVSKISENKKTLVFFVRHGDGLEPCEDEIGKGVDLGLTALGIKQAKEVAEKFYRIKDEIDVIYSSSMKRALETTKEISKRLNKKPVVRDNLREFNQILWTKRFYNPRYWKHHFKHKMSVKELDNILGKHKGETILIVAHGNLIKGLIGNKMKLPFSQLGKFNHDNCHITLARFIDKKLDRLYYFNSKELVLPKKKK